MFRKTIAAVSAAAIALSISVPVFAAPYDALIAAYAKSNGVPVALAKAVVKIESGFKPNKTGKAGEIVELQ